jgi:hypothetical protein
LEQNGRNFSTRGLPQIAQGMTEGDAGSAMANI